MASLRYPLALLIAAALTGLSQAATTAFGLQTEYTGPQTSAINTTATQSRNLGNLTGLTPGESIQIQFIPDNPVVWSGTLFYPAGNLELIWNAMIEISVDGHVLSFTDTWTLVAENAPESGPGGVLGPFNPGPPAMMRILNVPWGTDLSNITITLRDLSTFSGGTFGESSMSISGTLRTVSVPEPSALLMAGAIPVVLLVRRRGRTA